MPVTREKLAEAHKMMEDNLISAREYDAIKARCLSENFGVESAEKPAAPAPAPPAASMQQAEMA